MPTKRQMQANVESRWRWLVQKVTDELTARSMVARPAPVRVELLRRLLAAAERRDGAAMVEIGAEYVRRYRVLPPGVYATVYAKPRVYLDGDRLDPGERLATLQLGVVHAQIYR